MTYSYFIYIDDYTEFYDDTDKPIIKLGETCPDDTYDSSFNNFCINLDEDIFHFVKNPNELLKHNNPYIKNLETKEMVIRAYTSDKKLDDIDNNKDKLIRIDNSNCVEKIKKNYSINDKESLIIHVMKLVKIVTPIKSQIMPIILKIIVMNVKMNILTLLM